MKTHATFVAVLLALLALSPAAWANCTVSYKAKQDSPLRLQAGSIQLPDAACTSKAAAAEALAPILQNKGWTLLAITAILTDN
jgi:hypothetical protein